MLYEIPVTSDDEQAQSFELFGYSLRFHLRYNRVGGVWQFDLFNLKTQRYFCQSCGLAVNAPALLGRLLPFVVLLVDQAGLGLNSVCQAEMGHRLKLYFVDNEVWHAAIWQTNPSGARQ